METRDTLEEIFKDIWPRLTERERRLFAASEARKWGYGGISLVSAICGLSRATISKGLRELDAPPIPGNRIRRPGAGRPNLVKSDPEITDLLESRLPDPAPPGGEAEPPAGYPPPALSWTLKSTRTLARELSAAKHPVSYVKVGQILKGLGYSLKGNKKTGKERSRSESGAQYRAVDREAREAAREGRPIVHLESRSARGEPFDACAARTERAAAPPGAFAAGLVLRWWEREGSRLYAGAAGALLTVYDSPGGLFAGEAAAAALGALASALGAPVRVLFFPAGTHRWNYPSRELFSFLSQPGPASRRSIVRARLVAPAGPASGWTASSHVLEPPPGKGPEGQAREPGRESWARARGGGGGQEGWGFVVEP
ncbi:MAG: hypothetical protein LBG06_05005 [Deltaproteobacteria bacterium]|jgi:hypothetical protein|nr:hypothetical protein [Deltaproteobacteria bacterium]